MPALYLMTWDPAHARWRIQYKGKRHVVSCRQLGAPPNKEGSYQAANEWWRRRRAEIDLEEPQPAPTFREAALQELGVRLAWAERHGDRIEAERSRRKIEEVRTSERDDPSVLEEIDPLPDAEQLARLRRWGIEVRPDADPALVRHLLGGGQVWWDRLKHDQPVAPEAETVGGQVERWLRAQRDRVKAGGLSARAWDNLRREAERFRDHVGATSPLTAIDEKAVASYHAHLLGRVGEGEVTGASAKKSLTVMRQVIRHLYSMRAIELPRNLDLDEIVGTLPPVQTFTIDQVRRLLAHATGQLRLHILLGLNAGFTSKDCSDLQDTEVDWERGRITRKRSKSRGQPNAPTVTWTLWARTFDLLREYRSGEPTVLLTRTGGRWCWGELQESRSRRADNIAGRFNKLRERLGGDLLPYKHLRKTSATLLESHPEYGRYAQHFLGHAPTSIAAKHYTTPSQERFNEAVTWLGEQFLTQ